MEYFTPWPTERAYTAPKVQEKLSSIYYTSKGYWRGLAEIKKLATAAKVSEQVARDWLKRASHLADIFACPATHPAADV